MVVAEHLNFTRAAEALYVSQPALSKQIRALEVQLHGPLFTRDRRTVQLAPARGGPAARRLGGGPGGARGRHHGATHHARRRVQHRPGTWTAARHPRATRRERTSCGPEIRQISWDDPTGGLIAEGRDRTDAAFVGLPLADPAPYDWIEVATEPRLVALPWVHPLARRNDLDIADLLDKPFLALPASTGSLRRFWLATDARDGRPPIIGAEIASTEETVEALTAGLGVCLLAAGNAPLITRDGVAIRRSPASRRAGSSSPGDATTTGPSSPTSGTPSKASSPAPTSRTDNHSTAGQSRCGRLIESVQRMKMPACRYG